MQGCRIKYFLTTKMSWNDTNVFPYDTFYWKGIDGSQVLVHFNRTHVWPDPAALKENLLEKGSNTIQERAVSRMRLISYGFGDGGGGPEFGMIEVAKRLKDLEGMPRTSHTTVSRFMEELEESLVEPSVYSGELYLELHRGTLTNQHVIKRNNRKAEFALRDLEYVTVRTAIEKKQAASGERIDPLTEELLVNQFHDILPGTCIPRAHDEAIEAVSHIIDEAGKITGELLADAAEADSRKAARTVTLVNTLSFARSDVQYLPFEGLYVKGYKQQVVKGMDGSSRLAVQGVVIPAFGSVVLELTEESAEGESVFCAQGRTLETPMAKVVFNEKGYMDSFVDKRNGRELRGEGYGLNTLLMAEEVSLGWDNWDVDADFECKLQDSAQLLSREVVADGAVEYRIRSRYGIGGKSTLEQDMIFYGDSPQVVFETKMDWQEDHRFLKAAFDTAIHADYASHEVQFGCIRRTTNRNTSIEKARFEVSNHKYTDLSETRYGVAVLNDCKYGISVKEGQLRLSLHKGGCMPDFRGDKGIHECTYAFLPHLGGFSAGNVIEPAYLLNEKTLQVSGSLPMESLLTVGTDHVIVETVKPSERPQRGEAPSDGAGEKSFILRLYEAEGAGDRVAVSFGIPVKGIAETNLLEETLKEYEAAQELVLDFRPFEIKTLKIYY